MDDLQSLLRPRSIAILGASRDLTRVNGRTLKYLLDKGYAGKIFPVNPKYERIGPLECHATVEALPQPVDLAIIALPAPSVAHALRELGRRGCASAIVFSSGFAETGEAGRQREREVIAAARAAGVRLCGPNCLGLINAFDRVTATFSQFAEGDTPPGPVGFVTQSGAFGTAIAALAQRRQIGLGYFVNTGNEGDIDFAQAMRAVLADPRITVGAGYIEGLKDGDALVKLAEHAIEQGKPLVLTKVGRTGAGARAAASHTGSLAGAERVFDGVIRGFGVLRARNEENMLDMVEAFARCGLPAGRGLGIVTQSGGAGVLMADRAEELGLKVPVLSAATREALMRVIPAFGVSANPVDVTGQFIAEPRLLGEATRIVLSDPQVHIGVVWIQLMDAHADTLVGIFEDIQARALKPFVVCWVAAPERALRALRERGIAVLRGGEPAVDAAAALARYAEARRGWLADREARAATPAPRLDLPRDSGPLATVRARALLERCRIETAACALARNAEEAVAAAEKLTYPVALKIESADIPHKTEARGVKLALEDAAAVRHAYAAVVENARKYRPRAEITGVIVQKMAPEGEKLVVGLHRDPVFGTVVMAGLGGIHVEVLKDVVFRKAPVTVTEAAGMLDQLSGRAVLDGVRGRAAADRGAAARMIAAVSRLGAAAGDRLESLDLNPVLCGPGGVTAVDWLLVLK